MSAVVGDGVAVPLVGGLALPDPDTVGVNEAVGDDSRGEDVPLGVTVVVGVDVGEGDGVAEGDGVGEGVGGPVTSLTRWFQKSANQSAPFALDTAIEQYFGLRRAYTAGPPSPPNPVCPVPSAGLMLPHAPPPPAPATPLLQQLAPETLPSLTHIRVARPR